MTRRQWATVAFIVLCVVLVAAAVSLNSGWMLGSGRQVVPLVLGASDLDGLVQVREGLADGDRVVLYSEKALTARSRVRVVERIGGAP